MPSSRPARVPRALAPDAAVSEVIFAENVGGAGELDLASLGAAPAIDRAARGARAAARAATRRPADVLAVNVWADSPARAGWPAAVKRAVDVVGALVGLALALPLILLLAPVILLGSAGPVIFAHTRLGRDGRPFRCYKLRTMCVDAESHLASDPALRAAYRANDYKLPSHADRRVTPLGRFMRLSSLDELPQFWNVLRGDMALVGPRPIVDEELEHYTVRERRLLLSVRPGITGAWAVGGRSRISYPLRAQLELDYVRGWTFRRDLVILLRTAGAVLGRRGAS
jgi:lipopolysaccharide/colanic/teichoic acid biosynthesis glycosyltransferase